MMGLPGSIQTDAQAKAAAFASQINLQATLHKMQQEKGKQAASQRAGAGLPAPAAHFTAELEINDIPVHARWKLMQKETMQQIAEFTGAAIITKGVYVPEGKV